MLTNRATIRNEIKDGHKAPWKRSVMIVKMLFIIYTEYARCFFTYLYKIYSIFTGQFLIFFTYTLRSSIYRHILF